MGLWSRMVDDLFKSLDIGMRKLLEDIEHGESVISFIFCLLVVKEKVRGLKGESYSRYLYVLVRVKILSIYFEYMMLEVDFCFCFKSGRHW